LGEFGDLPNLRGERANLREDDHVQTKALDRQTIPIRGDRDHNISKVIANLMNLDRSILMLQISDDDRHMDSELIEIVQSDRFKYLGNFRN
jgi:predicted protein tyrosine phosphatase